MTDNQKALWLQWKDTANVKYLNILRPTHDPYIRPEEQVLINRWDIMNKNDAWDMQEFITRMYIKQLLRHPAFQLGLALLLVVNGITIALRTNSTLDQKHYELFSTIDDVVLTILFCEVLLGWFNGFWIFWKDGWNILNFLIVFILLLGFFIEELNANAITYTLRAIRLLHVCMAVEPLARIIRVILQSVPDLANIMALVLFFMLVFSVFGVTLFGSFVPKHFQNMQVALYTLFICITQDGWLDIYSDFQMEKREYAMEVGGAIYFAIFITMGAFIGINLFVVVVTTNLEQMMKAGEQGQQRQITFSEPGAEEEDESAELQLVHCAVARQETSGLPQEPLVGGPLFNLSEKTCDNFCLVLEAIQENLMQYKEIRDELNTYGAGWGWEPARQDRVAPPLLRDPHQSGEVTCPARTHPSRAGWRRSGNPDLGVPPTYGRASGLRREEVGGTHCRCAPRIVEEVRSIRFNQEQEEELMHRHLSLSLSFETGSSMDIREVAHQQDLVTALVNRERVRLPLPTQPLLTLPLQPLAHLSTQGLPPRQTPIYLPTPSPSLSTRFRFHPFLLEAPPLQVGSAPPPCKCACSVLFVVASLLWGRGPLDPIRLGSRERRKHTHCWFLSLPPIPDRGGMTWSLVQVPRLGSRAQSRFLSRLGIDL
ncbi:cation channel sperm-associated protein 4 isoform X2 [Oryctolagus cuniculus]|uniref:cation channel sperm-associated protein 4 isoform X2 n=1 Tax=Oryctolagus cuniculus TaxID=9986 RepID=UPI0022320CAE|nr:cation channel sperm-associated protein 4 isoform X2 [Oryctolagus cuniculus]